jgi:hypothetical protein
MYPGKPLPNMKSPLLKVSEVGGFTAYKFSSSEDESRETIFLNAAQRGIRTRRTGPKGRLFRNTRYETVVGDLIGGTSTPKYGLRNENVGRIGFGRDNNTSIDDT